MNSTALEHVTKWLLQPENSKLIDDLQIDKLYTKYSSDWPHRGNINQSKVQLTHFLKDILKMDPLEYVTKIHSYMYEEDVSLEEVILPDTITRIEIHGFDRCQRITKLDLGNSIKAIEDHAFSYCYGLSEVYIPDVCESIGYDAFQPCPKLTKISLPNTLKECTCEFLGCPKLDIEFRGTREQWESIKGIKSPASGLSRIRKPVQCTDGVVRWS